MSSTRCLVGTWKEGTGSLTVSGDKIHNAGYITVLGQTACTADNSWRFHRLYEQSLADKRGLQPSLHSFARCVQHTLSDTLHKRFTSLRQTRVQAV